MERVRIFGDLCYYLYHKNVLYNLSFTRGEVSQSVIKSKKLLIRNEHVKRPSHCFYMTNKKNTMKLTFTSL